MIFDFSGRDVSCANRYNWGQGRVSKVFRPTDTQTRRCETAMWTDSSLQLERICRIGSKLRRRSGRHLHERTMLHAGWAMCFLLAVGQSAYSEKFLPTWSMKKNSSSKSWLPYGDTAVYAYGLTVAELRTSAKDGSVVECKLTELQDPMECDTLVKKIGRPVVNVCLKQIMEIIQQCRALVQTKKGPPLPFNFHQLPFWNQVWNGIFPGTKWCGSGDIANGYHDLGIDAALDKCCRAHDHCPIKLKAFRRGHGLVNFSLYTKSHCSCDEDFLQCLIESHSESAAAIGNMYFNVLKVPCLRELDETRNSCKSDLRSVSKECQNEDTRGVYMKFLNTEKPFPLPGLNSES